MTIQAEANTPYVIAEPDSIEPMTFGTGTPFKDPGFNEANTLKITGKFSEVMERLKRCQW